MNTDPPTLEAYNEKSERNTRFEGTGLDTGMIVPCPGCAEPDWLRYKITGVEDAMKEGATCKHCGRGFKAIFATTPLSTRFTLVQTCGPDIPSYLPRITREAAPGTVQQLRAGGDLT